MDESGQDGPRARAVALGALLGAAAALAQVRMAFDFDLSLAPFCCAALLAHALLRRPADALLAAAVAAGACAAALGVAEAWPPRELLKPALPPLAAFLPAAGGAWLGIAVAGLIAPHRAEVPRAGSESPDAAGLAAALRHRGAAAAGFLAGALAALLGRGLGGWPRTWLAPWPIELLGFRTSAGMAGAGYLLGRRRTLVVAGAALLALAFPEGCWVGVGVLLAGAVRFLLAESAGTLASWRTTRPQMRVRFEIGGLGTRVEDMTPLRQQRLGGAAWTAVALLACGCCLAVPAAAPAAAAASLGAVLLAALLGALLGAELGIAGVGLGLLAALAAAAAVSPAAAAAGAAAAATAAALAATAAGPIAPRAVQLALLAAVPAAVALLHVALTRWQWEAGGDGGAVFHAAWRMRSLACDATGLLVGAALGLALIGIPRLRRFGIDPLLAGAGLLLPLPLAATLLFGGLAERGRPTSRGRALAAGLAAGQPFA